MARRAPDEANMTGGTISAATSKVWAAWDVAGYASEHDLSMASLDGIE